MEQTITTFGDPSVNAMDLPVTMGNGTIEIGAGAIRFGGVPQDFTGASFEVTSRADPASVFGYLVKEAGEFGVYFDECVQDGAHTPYIFQRGDTKELIAYLFHVVIPPNTTDVSGVDFKRWRIVAP